LNHYVRVCLQADDGVEQESSLWTKHREGQGTQKRSLAVQYHQPRRPDISLPERLADPSRIDTHRLELTWSLTAATKPSDLFPRGREEAEVVVVRLRDNDGAIVCDGEMNDPREVGHIAVDAEVAADREDRHDLPRQWTD